MCYQCRMISSTRVSHRPNLIAPGWHTWCLLVLLAILAGLLEYLRFGSATPKLSYPLLFCIVMTFEWTMFAFIIWKSNASFEAYLAGVLRTPRSLLLDIPVALLLSAISVLVSLAAVRVLGSAGWPSLEGMRPHNNLEIAVWIAGSLTAGICEETIFRGYLQQQFSAWAGRKTIGVCGQAVLFGVCHFYQGWKNMVLISVIGSIYGAFAVSRKGLRANMIAHAAMDIVSAF